MKPVLIHKNLKLLLVDDDPVYRNIFADVLTEYKVEVIQAWDGKQGYALYLSEQPHIVVSDIVMPNMSGYELVRKIRERDRNTPVILMSAQLLSGEDVYMGMTLGANDYMRIGQLSISEFIARINNCKIKSAIRFGNTVYEAVSCTLTVNDIPKQLTPIQAIVLSLLVYHMGEVVYRRDIRKCMGDYLSFESRSPDMCIKNLRNLLKDDPSVEIRTSWSRGYMLKTKR